MKELKSKRRKRLKLGIRKKLIGTTERPRVSVFKSNKGIYVQVIDDTKGTTLTSASSKELGLQKSNIQVADKVGERLAENAKKIGVESVVFDRNGYPYHGRIKSLAESARKGGLKF